MFEKSLDSDFSLFCYDRNLMKLLLLWNMGFGDVMLILCSWSRVTHIWFPNKLLVMAIEVRAVFLC